MRPSPPLLFRRFVCAAGFALLSLACAQKAPEKEPLKISAIPPAPKKKVTATPIMLSNKKTWEAELSLDGSRLVLAGEDGASLWNTSTASLLTPLFHKQHIEDAEPSPDGSLLVVDGVGTQLIDARTGAKRATLLAKSEAASDVDFSPDGKRIAAAVEDATKLWDAQTGKLLFTLPHPDSSFLITDFSLDGTRLLSRGSDSILLWDTQTGALVNELLTDAERIGMAHFSPDGEQIITTAIKKAPDDQSYLSLIDLWDAHTGAHQRSLEMQDAIREATLSPDGALLSTLDCTGRVLIVEAQTGSILMKSRELRGRVAATEVSFSSDGQLILVGYEDGVAQLWDVASRSDVLTFWAGPAVPVSVAKFSSKKDQFVTAGAKGAFLWTIQRD